MLDNPIKSLRGLISKVFENPIIRRLIANSGYLFGATGISAVLSFIQGILIARLLGVYNYGVLGAIILFSSIINKFASFRMGELVIKYVGKFTEDGEKERASATFKIALIGEAFSALIGFFILWLLSPLGAIHLVKDPGLKSWFLLYGLVILFNLAFESSTGLLQIFDKFRRIAVIRISQTVFTLSAIILIFINKGDLTHVLLAYMGGKLIGALGITGSAVIEASRRWGSSWWKSRLISLMPYKKEMTRFAISTYISATLSLVNKDGEVLWVTYLRNPLEAGYYRLALSLANLVLLPVAPLPQATYPELARETAKEKWSNIQYILKRGSFLAGIYTLLATAGLLFLGKPIIQYIYKPEFLPAFPALMIILIGFLVANTFYWNRVALLALGRPEFPTKVNFVVAVLKIILIFLLVPKYGYLASASLLAGSYILSVSIASWRVSRDLAYLIPLEKKEEYPDSGNQNLDSSE